MNERVETAATPPQSSPGPDTLLRLLGTTAIISLAVIIAVSSTGFYRLFSGFVIRSAEADSVHLSEMLIDQQQELLFSREVDGRIVLGLDESRIPAFDRTIRRVLAPFHIIKIKVYDPGKRIVYSTETALIGKVDEDNARLDRALAGLVDAEKVTKEKAHDLWEEPLLNVDVIETYVPIISPDGRVVGSFEVYVNVTPYREQILRGTTTATLLMAMVTAAVFGLAFLLVRRGAAQLREAQRQLETMASLDPLTGIPNRRSFFRRGEEEFARLLRQQKTGGESVAPLCCLLLDVDFFKAINDTWGHLAGDRVLREIAERLQGSVRPYDITGRYGGEEFVVLLPETPFETGMAIAERIRERIRGEVFTASGEDVVVTVSIGMACSLPTDTSLADLINRADDGLYRAKSEGRNRTASI
jgi:diguanylate cyclase (GGDEF)-like protein